MPDYLSGTLLDLRSSILPSMLVDAPTLSKDCGSSICEATGYVCPLCAIKSMVRLFLFCEETEWLCSLGIDAQRSSYGGPTSLRDRLESIPQRWSEAQSALAVVHCFGLLYAGQANSLLDGDAYVRMHGLEPGWRERTELPAEWGCSPP